MEDLKLEELIKVVNEYIRDNYNYNYADIFDDTITYHLEDGKVVNVYINLETEQD